MQQMMRLLTISVNVKIDNRCIERLVERVADKKRGKDGCVAKTETGCCIFAETAHED
jgi:hypothetical protein